MALQPSKARLAEAVETYQVLVSEACGSVVLSLYARYCVVLAQPTYTYVLSVLCHQALPMVSSMTVTNIGVRPKFSKNAIRMAFCASMWCGTPVGVGFTKSRVHLGYTSICICCSASSLEGCPKV